MPHKTDCAQAYYWCIEFIQPTNPDDDRYIMLHGEEGEIVGPMTIQLAEAWMDHFDYRQGCQAKEPSLPERTLDVRCLN